MTWEHDLDPHFCGARDDRVEIIHLEPEQNAVPVGPVVAIADAAVIGFDLEAVQLQDKRAILDHLLVVRSSVSPAATQKPCIPPAARFDVRDTDERLGSHGFNGSRSAHVKQIWSVCALRPSRARGWARPGSTRPA